MPCTCDLSLLVARGCQCGAIGQERAKPDPIDDDEDEDDGDDATLTPNATWKVDGELHGALMFPSSVVLFDDTTFFDDSTTVARTLQVAANPYLAEALAALRSLYDAQNGPPLLLPRHKESWGKAMEAARNVLLKHER